MITDIYNDLLTFKKSDLMIMAKYYNIHSNSNSKCIIAMELANKIRNRYVKAKMSSNSLDFIDLEKGEYTGNIQNINPGDLGYFYINELGKGSYGSVKLFMRPDNGDMVAIKYIKKSAVKESQVKYLQNELNTLMVLSNNETRCKKDIVCYYDFFADNDFYYIVMEYIPWFSLQKLINQRAFIYIRHKVHILHNICKALLFVHNNDFAHRDIKPDNIMVNVELKSSPGGKAVAIGGTLDIKLVDFGLSCFDTIKKIINDKCSGRVGSLIYMAPEILSNKQQPGQFRKTDVYSFGMTMYYFLTGKLLYSGATQTEIIKQVLANKYPNVSFPNVELADLIDDCLVYNPYNRPDMSSVCKRLERIKDDLYQMYENTL